MSSSNGSSTNVSKPEIRCNRRFSTNSVMGLTIDYVGEHPRLGRANDLMLEAFYARYAPLALVNVDKTEAQIIGRESIGKLQAWIETIAEITGVELRSNFNPTVAVTESDVQATAIHYLDSSSPNDSNSTNHSGKPSWAVDRETGVEAWATLETS